MADEVSGILGILVQNKPISPYDVQEKAREFLVNKRDEYLKIHKIPKK